MAFSSAVRWKCVWVSGRTLLIIECVDVETDAVSEQDIVMLCVTVSWRGNESLCHQPFQTFESVRPDVLVRNVHRTTWHSISQCGGAAGCGPSGWLLPLLLHTVSQGPVSSAGIFMWYLMLLRSLHVCTWAHLYLWSRADMGCDIVAVSQYWHVKAHTKFCLCTSGHGHWHHTFPSYEPQHHDWVHEPNPTLNWLSAYNIRMLCKM